MEYKIDTQQNSMVISLMGAFTFSDGAVFRDILQSIEKASTAKITFDLSALEFIDSSALGMLFLMREKHADRGNIILRHPYGQVLKIFELSEMTNLFQMEN